MNFGEKKKFWSITRKIKLQLNNYFMQETRGPYDFTEGLSRVLGVKRGTATCAIAKHAASWPTPACHTAGLARARSLTEGLRVRQRALPSQHVSATRQVLTPIMASLLWRRDVNA